MEKFGIWLTSLILASSLNAAFVPSSNSKTEIRKPIELTEVVRQTMEVHFSPPQLNKGSLAQLIQRLPVTSQYNKAAGVFVTLSRNGKPRACWGSVFPEHNNLVKSTVYATLGALTKDYRYRKISTTEWKVLKPQVTIIESVQPISSEYRVNPLTDGLFVRSGGKSGVILPGEARDAHYQLIMCKLKAGIQPGETFQLYRLRAHIYE